LINLSESNDGHVSFSPLRVAPSHCGR
jgi:hypothetical protein